VADVTAPALVLRSSFQESLNRESLNQENLNQLFDQQFNRQAAGRAVASLEQTT
jgi:hypothetical protein